MCEDLIFTNKIYTSGNQFASFRFMVEKLLLLLSRVFTSTA